MILDRLENLDKYISISPYMEQVMAFFEENDLSTLQDGRIELQGSDLFINVNTQQPKTRREAPLEAHVDYLDIQVPISDGEEMGFTPGYLLGEPSVAYSKETDVTFYPDLADSYINVRRGMFVIFFPGEGHAPAITENGVHKLIVKIRV